MPDRIFFGFGACHILAGVFLQNRRISGCHAEWIVPTDGHKGTHIFVTNGQYAFDFHGFCNRDNLLAHIWKGYQSRYAGWGAELRRIDFPLLDTTELNKRNHRGPDQFFGDPIARAQAFIDKKMRAFQDHPTCQFNQSMPSNLTTSTQKSKTMTKF